MLQVSPALNSAELDVAHGAMLRGELSSYSSTYLLHKELVRRGINVTYDFTSFCSIG